MMKLLSRIKLNDSGATAAEYALIIAVVGGGIVVAAVALGGSISTGMNSAGTHITTGK